MVDLRVTKENIQGVDRFYFGNPKCPSILLVGGYPKGYDEPFHPKTKSGKVLRGILQKYYINAELLDLWENQEQELKGIISQQKAHIIGNVLDVGWPVVALGRYVHKQILHTFDFDNPTYKEYYLEKRIPLFYLPHPASRRPQDIQKLEDGVKKILGKRW